MTEIAVVEQPTLEELRTKRRALFDRRDALDAANRRGLSDEEHEELFQVRVEIERLDKAIKLDAIPPPAGSPCPLHERGVDGMLARAQKLGDKLAFVSNCFKTESTLVLAHMRDACHEWYAKRQEEDTAIRLLEEQRDELEQELPAAALAGRLSEAKAKLHEVVLELEQSNLVRQARENEACLQWDRDVESKQSERERNRRVLELDGRRRRLVDESAAATKTVERTRAALEDIDREIAKLEEEGTP